jgi:hypothetical protein
MTAGNQSLDSNFTIQGEVLCRAAVTRADITREDAMNEVLKRFEAIAARARNGDASAEREFFDEAARLFPSDFAASSSGAGGEDRLDRALAIIRQNVSTGG